MNRVRMRLVAPVCAWILAAMPALAAAVGGTQLASGTPVLLTLEHHVTSAYTPVGSDIRLVVAEDVMAEGRILIRRGTPVRGRLRQAMDRAMLGTSASMTIGVDFIRAIDGQELRVVASETRHGRDRGNALAGWTLFWGAPGLMTRGVHSFALRGSSFEAQILFSRRIGEASAGPDAMTAMPNAAEAAVQHRFSRSQGDPYRLNLEREEKLGSVEFRLQWPAAPEEPAQAETDAGSWRAELVAVDGQPLSQPEPALRAGRDLVAFDSWSVLKYCQDGATRLRIRLDSPRGEAIELEYPLSVKLTHRQ